MSISQDQENTGKTLPETWTLPSPEFLKRKFQGTARTQLAAAISRDSLSFRLEAVWPALRFQLTGLELGQAYQA